MFSVLMTVLKRRVSHNWAAHGGVSGLAGLAVFVCALVAPPLIAIHLIEITPFTPMRLVPPLIWIGYIFAGMHYVEEPREGLKNSIHYVTRLMLWPLVRKGRSRRL